MLREIAKKPPYAVPDDAKSFDDYVAESKSGMPLAKDGWHKVPNPDEGPSKENKGAVAP